MIKIVGIVLKVTGEVLLKACEDEKAREEFMKMADTVSKEKRSQIMSRIRGKWTKPEMFAHNYLKSAKVRHKMHPKEIPGRPDVLFKDNNIALFIDGCFWHKCPTHYRLPKSNVSFWRKKIRDNVARDRRVTRELKKQGDYRPVRVWECQLTKDFLRGLAETEAET